jgi:hypothetical protein
MFVGKRDLPKKGKNPYSKKEAALKKRIPFRRLPRLTSFFPDDFKDAQKTLPSIGPSLRPQWPYPTFPSSSRQASLYPYPKFNIFDAEKARVFLPSRDFFAKKLLCLRKMAIYKDLRAMAKCLTLRFWK